MNNRSGFSLRAVFKKAVRAAVSLRAHAQKDDWLAKRELPLTLLVISGFSGPAPFAAASALALANEARMTPSPFRHDLSPADAQASTSALVARDIKRLILCSALVLEAHSIAADQIFQHSVAPKLAQTLNELHKKLDEDLQQNGNKKPALACKTVSLPMTPDSWKGRTEQVCIGAYLDDKNQKQTWTGLDPFAETTPKELRPTPKPIPARNYNRWEHAYGQPTSAPQS